MILITASYTKLVIYMLMINNLKNYLYDKKYFINFYDDYVHIFNYISLLDFNNEMVFLKMPNFSIRIKGDNLFITKMIKNELLIKGQVNLMEIINE